MICEILCAFSYLHFLTRASSLAGAGGNIFGSAPKPITDSPFGGGALSGAPDKPSPFGPSSGMKSGFGTGSAFGASSQSQSAAPAFGGSAPSAFGNPPAAVSNSVFGGGNAGKPAFGQSSSATMSGASNPSTGKCVWPMCFMTMTRVTVATSTGVRGCVTLRLIGVAGIPRY